MKVYDETISILKTSIEKAKIGNSDKQQAIKQLSTIASRIEKNFLPRPFLENIIQKEQDEAHRYGGMTVFGKAEAPMKNKSEQLKLF